MKTMLKLMHMPKNGIPDGVLPVFEHIAETYEGDEREGRFLKAMEESLTEAQRFRLYEQNGSCCGTGYDKVRKAFAQEHADKPLAERLQVFTETFGRKAVLNDDNTITVTFACSHGYYKHTPKGTFPLSEAVKPYFERCAGGRLYEYQKALGIKLRIKSVDVSPLAESMVNPVVFTFEVID